MKYKGYYQFHLAGAETKEEFYSNSFGTEDFANPRKRFQIFKKPRQYKIDIVLVNQDKDTEITEYIPEEKLTKEDITFLKDLQKELNTEDTVGTPVKIHEVDNARWFPIDVI